MQTTKLGINNNGYIPYVDYNRDYTPPPTTTSFNHVKTTNTSLSNHLIMCTSTATPTITSASIVGISTGAITNGTYSLTRNRPLDRLLNQHSPTLTSNSNGLMTSELHAVSSGIWTTNNLLILWLLSRHNQIIIHSMWTSILATRRWPLVIIIWKQLTHRWPSRMQRIHCKRQHHRHIIRVARVGATATAAFLHRQRSQTSMDVEVW